MRKQQLPIEHRGNLAWLGMTLLFGLGICVLIGLVLQAPTGSQAAMEFPAGRNGDIIYAQPITVTNTTTPNDTLVPSETPTSTPTQTPTLSPTVTETPTSTPTETVTGTPPTTTPTQTGTPTVTPTFTGTPPTPTATGTITPNLNITLSVVPGEARAGQLFTFRVTITNFGTAPAFNVLVTDTFTIYVDIAGATTSQGTVTTNASARTVNVNVGTIDPNQTVTIVITTTVNNFATITTIQTHNSVMIYTFSGIQQSKSSNVVSYRIVVGSTQPGTGGMELDLPATPRQDNPNQPFFLPALVAGLILFLAGIVALIYGTRISTTRPQWSGWYSRIGLLLLVAGSIFALGGLALNNAGRITPQLAEVPQAMPPTQAEIINFSLTPEAGIIPWPDELDKLPDYPIPTPTVMVTPGADGEKPDVSAATRLIIPAIGVDNIVKYVPFDGQTWLIAGLKEEIAWMGDTSWPGLGGNTGLAGHVTLRDGSDGPFRHLVDMQIGDEVLLYTEEKIYTYQVSQVLTIEDSDMSVLSPTQKPRITLVTCTDWSKELKMYLKRLIVVAELVESRRIHAAQ